MRTSKDVINRITHDPTLDPTVVTIGYHDRILNKIIEKSFLTFSNWGKIENAAFDQLAIPMHRVQYFKHTPTGTVLWDRSSRIDKIFNSTGGKPINLDSLFATTASSSNDDDDHDDDTAAAPQSALHSPLQRYLVRSNISKFEDVKALFKSELFGRCKVKESGDLFLVMYNVMNVFDSQSYRKSSDHFANALDHVRGVIYEKNSNKLICKAFDKFWDHDDRRACTNCIDWSTVTATKKEDGMLVKVFYYQNKWRVASNGCIDAMRAELRDANSFERESVGTLFVDALPGKDFNLFSQQLRKDRTYAFELCHPSNPIVVRYQAPALYHLCTRLQNTGELIIDDDSINVPRPEIVDLPEGKNGGEILDYLVRLAENMTSNEEGFVLCDAQEHRVKIKSKQWKEAAKQIGA